MKRTALYPMHLKYNAKLIDFGGWELPVYYESMGIIKEHQMVRENAGLFDVSHMGEILISGEKAEEFVQYLLTNDVRGMQNYQIIYTLMCYPHGGVVDDLLVYKYNEQQYLLVVNAANTDKDYEWIKDNIIDGVQAINVSHLYAQLALQGPRAQEILQKITDTDLNKIKYYWFEPEAMIAGVKCILSRTGYTGEDGFEIYLDPADAPLLWDEIMQIGDDLVSPIGLGARDSLRFEAKLPLYGQEIAENITPLEAGLGFFVKLDKGDFIGREALLQQKEKGPKRKLVEFSMIDKGIARSHYEVAKAGEVIGHVTTGMHSPTFKKAMGMALINVEYAEPGSEIEIIIRNRPVKAKVEKGIFYAKKTKSK